MLHKINFPGCVNQLEQIVSFQRKLLNFACSDSTSFPITENQLKAEFGDDIGEWLWNKLFTKRQSGKKVQTKLHKALEKLIKYIEKHSTMSAKIMDAFDHDIQFYHYLNDPNFKFKYSGQLSLTVQKLVRGILTEFYTELLSSSSGFPPVIHGQTQKFNRDNFILSFWSANSKLQVCPACDRPRSPKVDNKIYSDADHFLPKSSYPFLSVHHANLVPLCLDCNRTIKGDRNPIDDPDNAPLINTFHPYLNPAIDQVDIKTSRNAVGVREIQIEDKAGMPSRRVNSINRVFKLEKVWIDSLRYSVDSIIDEIQRAGERLIRLDVPLTKQELKIELQDMLRDRTRKLGQRHYFVLQKSYLEFAIQDSSELDELFAQFTGT